MQNGRVKDVNMPGDETTCGRKSGSMQKWRQMNSIPLPHNPCCVQRSETGTCDKTEKRHSHRQAESRGERGRKIRSDGGLRGEGKEGGRVLCNSWEFYWFRKTSPLIARHNQPAAADTLAGNTSHLALSHLPFLSLSHLPSGFSLWKCKRKHTKEYWIYKETRSWMWRWCILVWCWGSCHWERLQFMCAMNSDSFFIDYGCFCLP